MSARTQWEVTDAAGAVHLINVERQDVREWIDRAPCPGYVASTGDFPAAGVPAYRHADERSAVVHVALMAKIAVASVRRVDDNALAAARSRMSTILVAFEALQASLLLVLRSILDAEARNCIVQSLTFRELGYHARKLAADMVRDCLTDLAAGRADRINASDAAWTRHGCMGCWRAGFDAVDSDAVCEGCAAADDVVATIAAVDAEVSPC